MVYRVSSRTCRDTKRNPVWKTSKKRRKKERTKERKKERKKGRKEGRKKERKMERRKERKKERKERVLLLIFLNFVCVCSSAFLKFLQGFILGV